MPEVPPLPVAPISSAQMDPFRAPPPEKEKKKKNHSPPPPRVQRTTSNPDTLSCRLLRFARGLSSCLRYAHAAPRSVTQSRCRGFEAYCIDRLSQRGHRREARPSGILGCANWYCKKCSLHRLSRLPWRPILSSVLISPLEKRALACRGLQLLLSTSLPLDPRHGIAHRLEVARIARVRRP